VAFRQLYYTSCEHGLSGYPGYQFNAVTPGLDPDVLQTVETLVGYEPPQSVGYNPTPAEVATAPVNLCFHPADQGDATVIANVRFVDADFSQFPLRSGNYFAHALVTADPDHDLDGIVPIELWDAPFWASKPVESTELPELPELWRLSLFFAPGLSGIAGLAGTATVATGAGRHREAVARFLAAHHAADRLPALLSAVDRTIAAGDRSVVLVETDADRAAAWIGAVSYLLPPPLARRMSFATYQYRPSHSRLHLIGTVPDADIDLGQAGFEEFRLFDFPSGRMSQVQVHPAAELLAELGTVAAGRVWQRAASLAEGDERTLADWYAVATTAALVEGFSPAERHSSVAVAWLVAHGRRLDPKVVDAIWMALAEQRRDTPGGSRAQTLVHLVRLRERATGRPVLVDARLVAALWPDAGMSTAELRYVLAALPQDPAIVSGLVEPLSAALVSPLPDEGRQLDDHRRLCETLSTHPVRRQLSRDARVVLAQLRWVDDLDRWQREQFTAEAVETVARDFVAGYEMLQPSVKAYARAQLRVLLPRLEPDVVAELLADSPPLVIPEFAAGLSDSLRHDSTGAAAAARAYATMRHLDRSGAAETATAVAHALADGLAEWPRRDLAEVSAQLEQHDPTLAVEFAVWWRRQVTAPAELPGAGQEPRWVSGRG
jgi:hypothetical protein